MSAYEIATVALACLTAISAVSWGVLWRRGRKLLRDARQLASEYRQAVRDGRITDVEREEIAETVIDMVEQATGMWQALHNLLSGLAAVVRRR